MSKSEIVSFLPIRHLPITETAKRLAIHFYHIDDDECGDCLSCLSQQAILCAVVLSAMELYRPQNGWTITKLLTASLRNKKIRVNWDNTLENIIERPVLEAIMTELASEAAWHDHLEEYTRNPDVLRIYESILKCKGEYCHSELYDELVKSYHNVDFLELCMFEVIKSMDKYKLLNNVKGIHTWFKKTSSRLKKQLQMPTRKKLMPAPKFQDPTPLNGGRTI